MPYMALELPCRHYFGTSVLAREQTGLYFAEHTYAGGFQTPRHSHEQAYVCLILEGRGVQTAGNRQRDLRPSTVLFVPGGEIQSERFDWGPGRTFSFELETGWLNRLSERGFRTDVPWMNPPVRLRPWRTGSAPNAIAPTKPPVWPRKA